MRNGRIENWSITNCNYFSAQCRACFSHFLLLMPSFGTEQRNKKRDDGFGGEERRTGEFEGRG